MSRNKCRCDDLVAYCDLSTIEDDKLSVIASLMLGFSGEMSEREIKRIGEIIVTYLNRKKAFDCVFFNCNPNNFFDCEVKTDVAWLKSLLGNKELEI